MAEAGVPGYDISGWFGVLAPTNTSPSWWSPGSAMNGWSVTGIVKGSVRAG